MKTIEFVRVSYFDARRYFNWDNDRIKKEFVAQQLFIADAGQWLDLLYQKTSNTLGYLTTQ